MVTMIVAVVTGVWAGALASLGDQARRQASFTWWMVNRLLFLAAVTSIQGFATYFLISAFGVTSEEAIVLTANLLIVVGIFTLLTALPGGWLADRFGRKVLVGLAGLVAMFGTVILLITTLVPNLTSCMLADASSAGNRAFMSTNCSSTDLVPPGSRACLAFPTWQARCRHDRCGIGGVIADTTATSLA
jgi:MFS-type transporter involved in bile tolerance (Atg22 family)